MFFPTIVAQSADASSLPPSRRPVTNSKTDRAVSIPKESSEEPLQPGYRFVSMSACDDFLLLHSLSIGAPLGCCIALPTTNASRTSSIYHCSQTVAGILATANIHQFPRANKLWPQAFLFFFNQPKTQTGFHHHQSSLPVTLKQNHNPPWPEVPRNLAPTTPPRHSASAWCQLERIRHVGDAFRHKANLLCCRVPVPQLPAVEGARMASSLGR